MPYRPRLLHLILIALGLAVLAAGAFYYTNAYEPVAGLPAVSAPQVAQSPETPEACAEAGGVWNACASACPPGTEVCAQVCESKCEGVALKETLQP